MSKLSLIVLVLAFAASSSFASYLREVEIRPHFEVFKAKFGKSYADEAEEARRFRVFARNLDFIVKHNVEADLGLHDFSLGVNQFADMHNEEFRAMVNGLAYPQNYTRSGELFAFQSNATLPAQVDWRSKGLVTPIKNQGQCGSCWAFSTVASLEGQHAKATGKLVSLSEQDLVDCSKPEGNQGCEGGLMDNGFKYIKVNHGIDTEACYPYKGVDEKCRFKSTCVGATLKSWVDVPSKNEQALQQAVATVGPVSVAIDAGSMFFQFYRHGVYTSFFCSQTNLDHGVTVVGYGTENGKDYWLVKNSWGTVWGEAGYIKMRRNHNNMCGIATQASYPLV